MSKVRPNATLQARLGFGDPDLTTPAHDELLLWLTAALPDALEVLTDRLDIENRLPEPFKILTKKAEYPIVDDGGHSTYTVGFVDYYAGTKVYVTAKDLRTNEPVRWHIYCGWYFELKPTIRSLGELLRQLRMYETYCPKDRQNKNIFVVVSSDDTFRKAIENEGILFLDPSKDVPYKGAAEI